jgi:septum site-determining protein MinC
VQNQLLDSRQLQAIAASLGQQNLELQWVETTRRQTAVAAASAGLSVDQTPPEVTLISSSPPLLPPTPLLLRQTLRSGGEIRHSGDVVIIGDVNPGSSIVADGDILIWGCLRGTAHAGAKGNQEAVIMILRLAACQIRIADVVARVGADASDRREPEIAYITSEGIRLTPTRQFQRPFST